MITSNTGPVIIKLSLMPADLAKDNFCYCLNLSKCLFSQKAVVYYHLLGMEVEGELRGLSVAKVDGKIPPLPRSRLPRLSSSF